MRHFAAQATPLAKRDISNSTFCGRDHQVVKLKAPSESNLDNYSLPPRTLPADPTGFGRHHSCYSSQLRGRAGLQGQAYHGENRGGNVDSSISELVPV